MDSKFCDPHHKHIVTGDLRFIENEKLRSLLCKGPKYREPQNVNWKKFTENLSSSLDECIHKWASREKVDDVWLSEWKDKVMKDVKSKVQRLKKMAFRRRKRRSILLSSEMKRYVEKLQEEFVFVPTDKASSNIAIVCKKFYIEKSLQELDVFLETCEKKDIDKTYCEMSNDKGFPSIIKRHNAYMKRYLSIDVIPQDLPFLYWIPKMHKRPYSKQRYIAASHCCTTKPLSEILTKCFSLIEKEHRLICHRYRRSYGINPMWIINNSSAVHKTIATLNRKRNCNNIRTYDFSTLYTSIPHKQLKRQLSWVIKLAFKNSKKPFISVYKNEARWTTNPKKQTQFLDCNKVIRLMNWLIDNIYVTFGDKCFRQTIGIPMGTDCAPFLANLFLYSYEYQWIDKERKLNHHSILKMFKSCGRYIDDLFMVNNDDLMKKYMTDIYPKELILVPDDSDGLSAPFLDLQLTLNDNIISSSIFDKRDAFDFPIVNFPTLSGNIPQKSSYGVFVGELVRYARACTYYKDFEERSFLVVKKLKAQFFTDKRLKVTYNKFCDSHILLIQKYGPIILDLHNKWM
jgi:hypothetical protein